MNAPKPLLAAHKTGSQIEMSAGHAMRAGCLIE
jgi:hypothetical protein